MKKIILLLLSILFFPFSMQLLLAQDEYVDPLKKPPVNQDKKSEPGKEKQVKEKDAKAIARMMLEAQKYFPMEKGNWWEYKMKFETAQKDAPMPPDSLLKVPLRLEITKKEKNGCHIEPVKSPEIGGFSPIDTVVKDGYILQNLLIPTIKDKMKVLKLPPAKGEKWETTSKDDSEEKKEKTVSRHSVIDIGVVEVPAGKFAEAVCVTTEYEMRDFGEEMKLVLTTWYAPGAGMVKQVFGTPRGSVVFTLTKFHVKGGGAAMLATAVTASGIIVIIDIPEASEKEKPGAEKALSPEEALKQAKELKEKKIQEEMKKLAKAKENTEKPGDKKPVQKPVEKVIQVSLNVEKVLKGELKEKEVLVSLKRKPGKGKWVLFLDNKLNKAYSLIHPPIPAEKEVLEKLDSILNPPGPATLAAKAAEADCVMAGKALVKEDREGFSYWVFEIEEVLKGGKSRTHIDVLVTEGMQFEKDKRYILALKAGEYFGRKLNKVLGDKPDTYSKEKLEEYKETLKK